MAGWTGAGPYRGISAVIGPVQPGRRRPGRRPACERVLRCVFGTRALGEAAEERTMLDVRAQQTGGFRAFAARDAERQAASAAARVEASVPVPVEAPADVTPAAPRTASGAP